MNINSTSILQLLQTWAEYSERHWNPTPAGGGFYGTGFNNWGVQTNQKYLGALAILATHPDSPSDRDWALNRALAALRYSLQSHHTGGGQCTDGTQWGRTWISALGIERMMFGVHLLREYCDADDQSALQWMLTDEADYLLHDYSRTGIAEITGDQWNESRRNVPESNIWNGALLWRVAALYPNHPRAAQWQERAHRFLINGVSVPDDAADETIIAGKTVRERFAGANFFPHYALDHHGYFNVGYMTVCVSNAAILHFDLKRQKLARPATLDHHQRDLWGVLRRMIFANGRLARLGGDSRVRYTYCQEYLLPSLLYAADQLGEAHAAELLEAQIQLIQDEAEYSGDGSFYGTRLKYLQDNPYYLTRLESDRACCLAMLLEYSGAAESSPTPECGFEDSAIGAWHEPEYGAVMHRCSTRLASFSWRAHGFTQGLCLSPADGHLAEWQQNLSSSVRFLGDDGVISGGQSKQRRVLSHHSETFEGGFVTCGEVVEGCVLAIPEGGRQSDVARHFIAYVALPDNHTVIGLELIRATDKRSYLQELKGLHCAFANDLYNGCERRLTTENGEMVLTAPAPRDETISLGSRWANVEGRIGVVGLYGAVELSLHRVARRRGGPYQSLFTEEICFSCRLETRAVEPHEVLLDIGWLALSQVTPEQTARVETEILDAADDVRAVRVLGQNGKWYGVVANFGAEKIDVADWFDGREGELEPGRASVVVLDE